MSYNLFLDDIRTPESAYSYTGFHPFIANTWIIVRNYDEFVSHINENGLPDFIAFDHDLAKDHYAPQEVWDSREAYEEWETKQDSEELNGYDCAKWLTEYCMDNDVLIPEFFVHSMNPYGAENIRSLLSQFRKFQENEEDSSVKGE